MKWTAKESGRATTAIQREALHAVDKFLDISIREFSDLALRHAKLLRAMQLVGALNQIGLERMGACNGYIQANERSFTAWWGTIRLWSSDQEMPTLADCRRRIREAAGETAKTFSNKPKRKKKKR